jgi:hypothetical protein
MLIEPWGHPDPPEITPAILKEEGAATEAAGAASGRGLARERVAKASAVNVCLMLRCVGDLLFNINTDSKEKGSCVWNIEVVDLEVAVLM